MWEYGKGNMLIFSFALICIFCTILCTGFLDRYWPLLQELKTQTNIFPPYLIWGTYYLYGIPTSISGSSAIMHMFLCLPRTSQKRDTVRVIEWESLMGNKLRGWKMAGSHPQVNMCLQSEKKMFILIYMFSVQQYIEAGGQSQQHLVSKACS